MTEIDYYSDKMAKAKEVTNALTNFVNNFSYQENSDYFNAAMHNEHRTLQQSFTRLMLGWLEFVASDLYMTDGRNADSHVIAGDLMKAFGDFIEDKYGHECEPRPAMWLGTV